MRLSNLSSWLIHFMRLCTKQLRSISARVLFFNNLWPGLLCTALGQCLMSKRDHSDVTPDPDETRTWDDLAGRVVRLRIDCLDAFEQIG